MQLLLADEGQRELYLELVQKREYWERLVPFFGAPPYSFLRPEDAGKMRAAGFAKGRQNMTYDEPGRIANVAQFGPGHLIDREDRIYRVAPLGKQQELPGPQYLRSQAEVYLQVRLRKRSKSEKAQLFRSNRKKLYFPQPGDRLSLRESRQLMTVLGQREATLTNVVVKAVRPRAVGAYTAALVVRAAG